MGNIVEIEAVRKWNNIPSAFQQKILDNVFCGECLGTTTIIDYDMKIYSGDLVLEGKCKQCGHKVARLIESE